LQAVHSICRTKWCICACALSVPSRYRRHKGLQMTTVKTLQHIYGHMRNVNFLWFSWEWLADRPTWGVGWSRRRWAPP
jgi:hypothetical protein